MRSWISPVSLARFLLAALLVAAWACGPAPESGTEGNRAGGAGAEPAGLGPTDGLDLPPTDLERVAVGTMAPDFSLETLAGDTVTLSQFRGVKDVVLVFYRGHW